MKITVEISDSELREIRLITGEKKKGPAIRRILVDALRLKRRELLTQRFLTGEASVEFNGYEEAKKTERTKEEQRASAWKAR